MVVFTVTLIILRYSLKLLSKKKYQNHLFISFLMVETHHQPVEVSINWWVWHVANLCMGVVFIAEITFCLFAPINTYMH